MKSIVLIDDEFDILEIIKSSLELIIDEHISYHTFSNPVQAIRFIQANAVDLVVTDLNMDNINGLEVYHKLRINSNVKKFIFISGQVNDYKNELNKINDCHVLEKPIKINDLANVVKSCITEQKIRPSKKWFFF